MKNQHSPHHNPGKSVEQKKRNTECARFQTTYRLPLLVYRSFQSSTSPSAGKHSACLLRDRPAWRLVPACLPSLTKKTFRIITSPPQLHICLHPHTDVGRKASVVHLFASPCSECLAFRCKQGGVLSREMILQPHRLTEKQTRPKIAAPLRRAPTPASRAFTRSCKRYRTHPHPQKSCRPWPKKSN